MRFTCHPVSAKKKTFGIRIFHLWALQQLLSLLPLHTFVRRDGIVVSLPATVS